VRSLAQEDGFLAGPGSSQPNASAELWQSPLSLVRSALPNVPRETVTPTALLFYARVSRFPARPTCCCAFCQSMAHQHSATSSSFSVLTQHTDCTRSGAIRYVLPVLCSQRQACSYARTAVTRHRPASQPLPVRHFGRAQSVAERAMIQPSNLHIPVHTCYVQGNAVQFGQKGLKSNVAACIQAGNSPLKLYCLLPME
jgi:hypothetical protein